MFFIFFDVLFFFDVFSYFGRFSAACFLEEVQTFEKSRRGPFFVKTSDYALEYIKLPVWTCITVAAGQKT